MPSPGHGWPCGTDLGIPSGPSFTRCCDSAMIRVLFRVSTPIGWGGRGKACWGFLTTCRDEVNPLCPGISRVVARVGRHELREACAPLSTFSGTARASSLRSSQTPERPRCLGCFFSASVQSTL